MLKATDIRASYGAVPVLHGISLQVRAGEIVAVLGRNGVGKTTLLRTLIGDLPLQSGSIRFDGTDVSREAPNRRARRGMAYVPQGRGIFPRLSVRENLLTGMRARRTPVPDIPRDVLERFPILIEKYAQRGGALSGGQQQQLALARALCGEPKLLLLDEPSEGIQPSIVGKIGELLKAVSSELGIAVLVVEQNIDLARQVADRAIVIEKGLIGAELSGEELMDDRRIVAAMSL